MVAILYLLRHLPLICSDRGVSCFGDRQDNLRVSAVGDCRSAGKNKTATIGKRQSLHGVFDDQEFNPEHHHADRRSQDRQKNDDRGVGAALRAMFSVEVSAHPVVE
jgi:hypothetical protein